MQQTGGREVNDDQFMPGTSMSEPTSPGPGSAPGADSTTVRVGELEQRLAEVSDLVPAEQVAVFEQLHTALSDRLSEQPG